jgi:acyl carrier protein
MSSRRDDFILKLKAAVVECCNVKNVSAAEISTSEPIIGGREKLKLDSLDALEIVVMVEQRFGIRLSGDESARALFQSFDKMADYLLEHASEEKINDFLQAS